VSRKKNKTTKAVFFLLSVLVFATIGFQLSRISIFSFSEYKITGSKMDPNFESQLARKMKGFLGRSLLNPFLLNEMVGAMSSIKEIKDVKIRRLLPSMLILQFEWHKAVAQRATEKSWELLNETCEPFKQVLKKSERLPVVKGVNLPSELCTFLSVLRYERTKYYSFSSIQSLEWGGQGLTVTIKKTNPRNIFLGKNFFKQRWQRFRFALTKLAQKNLYFEAVDAAYPKRVIFQIR